MDEQERKTLIRNTFDTVATGYDNEALRFFPLSAKFLTRYLAPKDDAHILDVACGTGVVALNMARDTPKGHVTAIDLSEGMLSQAAKKADQQALKNVSFEVMDFTQLQFPDNHFDSASCGFGIFFIDDMQNGLSHINSKIKPGGKIALCSFYEDAFSPLLELFLARIEKYGIEPPPLSWKRIAKEQDHTNLHLSAGLQDVSVFRENVGYYLEGAQQWWDVLWNAGFRGLLNQLSESDLALFHNEHLVEIQEHANENGIWLDINVLYSVGRKA